MVNVSIDQIKWRWKSVDWNVPLQLRQHRIRTKDPKWVDGCVNTLGEDRHPNAGSVACCSFFLQIHYFKPHRSSPFWHSAELSGGAIICYTPRAGDSEGGLGKKSGAGKEGVLSRILFTTRWVYASDGTDECVLPVGIVLDPGVRVVVWQLRGRSRPERKEKEKHRKGAKKTANECN